MSAIVFRSQGIKQTHGDEVGNQKMSFLVMGSYHHSLNSSPLDKMTVFISLADDIFKCIFVNEKFCISIKISLKFVPKGPIYDIPALVQI